MKIQTLAKKLETASKNTVKFMKKADEAKTERTQEVNEYKSEEWNAKALEITMLIKELFTTQEIEESANEYLILRECL